MFILRDILLPLQDSFSDTKLGRKRAQWFTYTLLSVIIPFTSSMTSNLLRTLQTLFGLTLNQGRFYVFMASPSLPWNKLWTQLWSSIPEPLTDGRIVLALDDFINTKVGRKIFACETIFDHAAKANQSKYPWAQNVVVVGLLKSIKGRWACLPMAFKFYLPQKAIEAKTINVMNNGKVNTFQTKLAQAATMIIEIASHFAGAPILVVTDSWFGNNGLFKPVRQVLGLQFNMLSRLRISSNLYDLPTARRPKQRGATRKYGAKLGSVANLAVKFQRLATSYQVHLYGKFRNVSAYDQVFMIKTLKCPIRVVWVYRRTRWVALFTTDLKLSVEQIISIYGARWKIESGFKELKQEIGSQKSQTRGANAVSNHLQFCMMSVTLTWIYAEKLKPDPQRRHKVKGRTSFAFSDVRRMIAEAALSEDFNRVCPKPSKPQHKSLVDTLLRIVA